MSAIHAGEVLLLGGALSFPIGGWFLVVTLLGLGGIIFGTGYLSDKKIVNEYKELDNKIINAEENLVEQNSKILQKEEDTTRETIHQSKTKIKNKTTETEVVIDETKEI